jgi:hypothetical protein
MKISNKTHLKNKRTDVYFSDRERKKRKKKETTMFCFRTIK